MSFLSGFSKQQLVRDRIHLTIREASAKYGKTKPEFKTDRANIVNRKLTYLDRPAP